MSSAAELSDPEAEPGNTADRPYPSGIPEATVARLPVYLRALYALAERGVTTVASDELARAAGVNSAKLRKDLSHLGSYGIRGVGYDVEYLVYQVITVLGGSSNLGGVRSANIAVGKDIVGLNIQHGIFNSLITAGVLIDGSPQNSSSGGNIGPDGSDAIFDSQLLAGVQIKNLLINGNVTSDYVTNPKPNPTGYPTRIVAGEVLEDRAPGRDSQGGFPQGTFTSGGNIDNFQITGSLIDSVLAASVAPYGGNGTLPFANGFSYSAPPPSRHSGRPGIQHLRCSGRNHRRRDCGRHSQRDHAERAARLPELLRGLILQRDRDQQRSPP